MLVDTLDIKCLRAFQLAAKNGSLRVAANRLKQTIPAISLRIRRLERDIGVELFERLPNKMILTVAGARFLREVDMLLDRAEQALKELSSPQIAGHLSVSIGSDHSWFFAPRLSSYLNRHPGVELRLEVYRSNDAIAGLQRGELDLALGIFPNLPRGLQKEIVVETALALLCPCGHPLTRRQPARLPDLAGQRLILPPPLAETRKVIDRSFAKASVQPDNLIEVANCSTAKTFVERGVGVAIVHSLCAGQNVPPTLQWIDLGKQIGRIEFCAAYRKGGSQSHMLQGLVDELCRTD